MPFCLAVTEIKATLSLKHPSDWFVSINPQLLDTLEIVVGLNTTHLPGILDTSPSFPTSHPEFDKLFCVPPLSLIERNHILWLVEKEQLSVNQLRH